MIEQNQNQTSEGQVKDLKCLRNSISSKLLVFTEKSLEVIDNLIEDYIVIERNFEKDFTYEDICNLMFLFLIKENYATAKCYKDKAFIKKLVTEKNMHLINSIDTILTKQKTDPYTNIYETIYKLFEFGKSTQVISEAFLNIYEQRQASFLSKIYKNIKQTTLLDLIKPHIDKDNIETYAKKYNLSKIEHETLLFYSFENFNTCNVEKTVTGEYKTQPDYTKDSNYVSDNLTFINKNANELENLVKASFLLQNK